MIYYSFKLFNEEKFQTMEANFSNVKICYFSSFWSLVSVHLGLFKQDKEFNEVIPDSGK